MQSNEFSLVAADGVHLHGRNWLPAAPRAAVVLVHGICEHSGRYGFLAERLAGQGIATFSVDLRGHGRSPGERAWVERFDDYLHDVDALLAKTREQMPQVPLFLMGHSMGGAIALRWTIARPPSVRGLILSSAALQVGRNVPRALVALAPLLSRWAPHVRGTRVDPAVISRDAEQVRRYVEDPLNSMAAPPARTGAEILKVMRSNLAAAATVTLPTYLFHGDADTLTDPAGSLAVHAALGSPDKTLRLWPGSFHETLNDFDREAVAGELLAWLNARI